jgi:hypothetical protein
MTALRGMAIALAGIAILDPGVPLPRRERPGVRLAGAQIGVLADRLHEAGFTVVSTGEAAAIVTPDAAQEALAGSPVPLYVLDRTARAPGVTIERASVSATRVAGQAVTVSAVLQARGERGRTTTLAAEEQGVTVASATHTWKGDEDAWNAVLAYMPVTVGSVPLRVRASTSGAGNAEASVDVLAPPLRSPIRTLVYAPSLSWPLVFVRRALEAQPGFAVASLQRASAAAVTRAGAPPPSLRRVDLAPYELLVCGALDRMDVAGIDAIRWFVEERGGVLVLLPDRPPAGRVALLPGLAFESRVLDNPVALRGVADGLVAAELVVVRGAGALATPLAVDPSGAAIVIALRRGAGAIVISGALDAWRYRDRADAAFSRFWPTALLAEAAAVPPRLDVAARPSAVRPGDLVHVRLRLRASDVPDAPDRVAVAPARVHALDPAHRVDEMVRVWPSAEPGVYEGEWRPSRQGQYAVDAEIGDAIGAAAVTVDAGAATLPPAVAPLRIASIASGGGVFTDDTSLIRTLSERFPASSVVHRSQPSRSPWWGAAFAGFLSIEWALRRRRGRA